MNCLDCAHAGRAQAAVAICGRCGAAVCREHLAEERERLMVRMPINVPVPVDPPARKLRCPVCAAAEQAVARTRVA